MSEDDTKVPLFECEGNGCQDLMEPSRKFTRRELLKYAGAAAIGALIAYFGIEGFQKPTSYTVTKTIYKTINKPANATETVTITVTKTSINSQAPQTYTTTTTVTETATQTVTETITETSTIPSPTTTTTTTTQPPKTLEEILFGNSDIQFIPLEVKNVKIDNNTAYLTVYDYLTNTELQIELPTQYVSNGSINIGDLLSAANNFNSTRGTNYKVYFVLGRANINQAILQNGTWNLPAPQIYYNIIISDGGWEDVYNALQNLLNGNATVVMPTSNQGPYANTLYAWINGIGSIIISYQNGQQVNNVENSINLANSILGTPNNPNPTGQGTLHVDNIANVQQEGKYNNQYPVYEVNKYFGTYTVLITEQGTPLVSNL